MKMNRKIILNRKIKNYQRFFKLFAMAITVFFSVLNVNGGSQNFFHWKDYCAETQFDDLRLILNGAEVYDSDYKLKNKFELKDWLKVCVHKHLDNYDQFKGAIQQATAEFGLPSNFLACLIYSESNYNSNAQTFCCAGLVQFSNDTADMRSLYALGGAGIITDAVESNLKKDWLALQNWEKLKKIDPPLFTNTLPPSSVSAAQASAYYKYKMQADSTSPSDKVYYLGKLEVSEKTRVLEPSWESYLKVMKLPTVSAMPSNFQTSEIPAPSSKEAALAKYGIGAAALYLKEIFLTLDSEFERRKDSKGNPSYPISPTDLITLATIAYNKGINGVIANIIEEAPRNSTGWIQAANRGSDAKAAQDRKNQSLWVHECMSSEHTAKTSNDCRGKYPPNAKFPPSDWSDILNPTKNSDKTETK